MARGIPKETRFLWHAEKPVSSNAFVCCQKRKAEGLREGFQAVRSTGRQIPHVPFRLQLLGQGREAQEVLGDGKGPSRGRL